MSIPTIEVSCGSIHVDLVSVLVQFGIIFCLYLMVSLTVNIEFGYSGIPNFGKVLFVAAGGLVAGSLSYRLAVYALSLKSSDVIGSQATFFVLISNKINSSPLFGLDLFLFSLAVGAVISAIVGYSASFPAIKLREDYLGMLLLAAGQFFQIFVTAYYPITGGTEGLLVPDPLSWSSSVKDLRDILVLGIVCAAAVLIYLYSERIARSPLGRMLRAIRDNEISSNAIGKNSVGVSRNVLIIASAISGIVGVLYITWLPAISPLIFQRQEWTFYPFVIVILGGAANNKGVALGSAVFATLLTTISQAQACILANGISLPIDINAIVPISLGVLLLVILMWRPKGLLPEKPTVTLKKSKLRKLYEKTNKMLGQEETRPPPQSPDMIDQTASEIEETE